MRNLTFTAIAASLLLINCSPSSERKVENAESEIRRDIKKEKDITAQTLRVLRNNINDTLDKISRKFDDASGNAKVELGDVKDLLIVERTKVQKALDAIDESSDTTWDDNQQAAKNTSNEVKITCERMDERIVNAIKNASK